MCKIYLFFSISVLVVLEVNYMIKAFVIEVTGFILKMNSARQIDRLSRNTFLDIAKEPNHKAYCL